VLAEKPPRKTLNKYAGDSTTGLKKVNNTDNLFPQKKAAMYVRMSTEHQKYSTENQEIQIRDYAEKNNIEIIKIYHDDGKSGLTLKNRKGMQTLLDDVQSGHATYEFILVLDTTRWGRYQNFDESGHYEYLCSRANIKVIYVTEPYLNDDSPSAGVMKVVQRMGAADYSARLSDKVFRGQCTLIQKGYRQGGMPGFGLRRMMIDEHGREKCVLEKGQHKSFQTDRVILVPGPEEEIEVVRWIYHMFVDEDWNERQIADSLNQRNITTDLGREWTRGTIHQILTNPKYIGHNVLNRQSFKLKERRVKNPQDQWIVKEGAFEAIVEIKYFYGAQVLIRERNKKYSNDDLLAKLKELRERKGWLSAILIDETDDMPSSSAYASRFGGLTEAYSLIGYTPARDIRYIKINKHLRTLYPDVCEGIIHRIQELGGSVHREISSDLLFINNEVKTSIVIARCHKTQAGSNRWKIRFDTGLNPDITIVARMDEDNKVIRDYYIIPAIDIENPQMRLADNNGLALDCYRFNDLEDFFNLTRRVDIQEAA
jgi:DNA invertase Pin-like site-specific DNA recombinase